ncbi:VOC family protein [Brachybacterium massiliense]|uniref:VOC family protein n=1 Tax=Brachybacterium massiliense TaxID=1755098 RepID=UPI000B3BC107|nr:VOC family protein [Brachybacterium massiliense]
MTSAAILGEIGQVFIPVRDIEVSSRWYARLLNIDVPPTSHGDTIVDLPVQSGPRLCLDANAAFTADGPPRFFWWTDDLTAFAEHLAALGIPLMSEITDIGSVAFLHFRDPDGTLLMACESRESPKSTGA